MDKGLFATFHSRCEADVHASSAYAVAYGHNIIQIRNVRVTGMAVLTGGLKSYRKKLQKILGSGPGFAKPGEVDDAPISARRPLVLFFDAFT